MANFQAKLPGTQVVGNTSSASSRAAANVATKAAQFSTRKRPQSVTSKELLKLEKDMRKEERKDFRRGQRAARRAIRMGKSEELQATRIMHNTIRQAIAEGGVIAAQGINALANNNKDNAIKQNTDGGILDYTGNGDPDLDTSSGLPVALGRKGRKED